MITVLQKRPYDIETGGNKYIVELACLSTDTKPTDNIVTGSMALEVDTGDLYAFDEVSETWGKL